MTTVGAVYDAIDGFAPFHTAENWDNAGLLVGARDMPVERALVALDLTGPVLEEARQLGATLVVTHHPVIFRPLKTLDPADIPCRAAAAGIAVISAHTNLDKAAGGVNDALAASLGLQDVRPLGCSDTEPYRKIVVFAPLSAAEALYDVMAAAGAGRYENYTGCGFLSRGEGRFLPLEGASPTIGTVGGRASVEEVRLEMVCAPHAVQRVLAAMRETHPYEAPAYDVLTTHALHHRLSVGRVGELPQETDAAALAAHVRDRLSAAGVRYSHAGGPIRTVAVCGGAGADDWRQAKGQGAQAMVTAEVKHNLWLEAAETGFALLDAGHFATENVVVEPLRAYLEQQLPGAAFAASRRCTDGVHCISQ